MIITVVMLLLCRMCWLDESVLLVEAAAAARQFPEDYLYLSSSPEPEDNSLDYRGNGLDDDNNVIVDEIESNDLQNLGNITVEEMNESQQNESLGLDENDDTNNTSYRRKALPVLRDPLEVVIPVTFIFALILLIGLIGNVSTCIVIAKNNYMHTATNYYLFSLAVSDLLLLISGLPQEMYLIWLKWPYIFGEAFCLIRGLAAETSANATVLTITAFTVERYVAICHPLRSHKLSQLSRVVTIILSIWLIALLLALPQAAQFGVIDEVDNLTGRVMIKGAWCTIKRVLIPYAFQISICVFFVIPMTMITVLYVLIGLKLRRSRGPSRTNHELTVEPRTINRHSQSHVIRMLIAVVVAFFICWAPFHIQRLMAIYSKLLGLASSPVLTTLYKIINYVSGILYYVSTCINPILYHIMSNKFRQAFKDTMGQIFGRPSRVQHRSYSSISHNRSSRMGVHHHLHQYHHYGSRRGEHQETCINCRHTPTMCSCRGNSQKYVRTYNLEQTGSDTTTVSLLSTSPSDKDPVIALASLDTSKGPVRETPSQSKPEQPSGLKGFKSIGFLHHRADPGVTNETTTATTSTSKSLLPQNNSKRLNSFPVGEKPKGQLNGKKKNLLKPGSKATKMMLILRKKKKPRSPNDANLSEFVIQPATENEVGKENSGGPCSKTVNIRKDACRALSQTSVDSNNTISNSSLQDLDENEYTGEELAGVLAELKESMESPKIM